MNKEEYKDYLKLSGKITEKLDNTATYENWLIIQEYIDRAQQKAEQLEQKDKEIDRLNNIIKELSKDVDMWNKKYNEQFNIITELEKELREGSFDVYFCSTNTKKTFKSNEIIIKSLILDKLKALKENNNE